MVAALCLWIIHRHGAAIFSVFVATGVIVQWISISPIPTLAGEEADYEATIESVRDEDGARMLVCDVDGVGIVNLRLYGALPIIEEGNRVAFHCRLDTVAIQEEIVPDEILSTPGEAIATGTVSAATLKVTDPETTWRNRIIGLITSSGVNDRTGSMLCALLLGHSSLLDEDVRNSYSAAGLSHVLALSGLHVGVITMLIGIALWPLYLGRHNRTRRLITIAALWAYAAMTGFSPSVTRAVIMATVYIFGRVIQRDSPPMNSLCFAAILILVIWPSSLRSISFQLSFSAVAGILLFYPMINRINRRKHPWLYRIVSYPALSLSAMAFTGIISAFYFHSYPLYFLLANLAISPFVPLLIGGGAVMVIFMSLGIQSAPLCSTLDLLTAICNEIADKISMLPGHAVTGLYISPWITLMGISAVAMLALWTVTRRRAALYATATIAVLTFQFHYLSAEAGELQEHYFLKDHSAANILIKDNDSLYLLTSAPQHQLREEIAGRCERRFRHYIEKRKLAGITLMPDTLLSPYVSRTDNHFAIDGRRYAFLDKNSRRPKMPIDYLIVVKGFTGDIVDYSSAFKPDSAVILSSSLHQRRLKRYADELRAEKIPFKIF